jgi:hypothetical protein
MAIDLVMTANESPKCTTVKKSESCARDYRNRQRSRRILRQNPSDQTPCSELDRSFKRCGMDVCNGHGLPYNVRRVVAGAPVRSVPSPVAVTGVRNPICIFLNHPNLPTPVGISASIAASARRQFFSDWIAAKDKFSPSHLESSC